MGKESAEDAYKEHRYVSEDLDEVKQKKEKIEKREKEYKPSFFGKIEDKLFGRSKFIAEELGELGDKITRLEQAYKENLEKAELNVNDFKEEAEGLVESWKVYAEEMKRLSEELDIENPELRDISDFIDEQGHSFYFEEEGFEKQLAISDIISPRIEEPLKEDGLITRPTQRVPKMNIGVAAEAAFKKGKEEKLSKFLLIKKEVKRTSGHPLDINRTYPTRAVEKAFIPISGETAELASKMEKESVTWYGDTKSGAVSYQWPNMVGLDEYEFVVLDNKAVKEEMRKEKETKRMTLNFEIENYGPNGKTRKEEILITGANKENLKTKAIHHLIEIEMSGGTEIAKNVEVEIEGKKFGWNDFLAQTPEKE